MRGFEKNFIGVLWIRQSNSAQGLLFSGLRFFNELKSQTRTHGLNFLPMDLFSGLDGVWTREPFVSKGELDSETIKADSFRYT